MSPQEISFWVPGIPKPAGSKRGFVNRKTGGVIITDACKNEALAGRREGFRLRGDGVAHY